MENYSDALRPVEDTDKAINVSLQITLSQIKDMVSRADIKMTSWNQTTEIKTATLPIGYKNLQNLDHAHKTVKENCTLILFVQDLDKLSSPHAMSNCIKLQLCHWLISSCVNKCNKKAGESLSGFFIYLEPGS